MKPLLTIFSLSLLFCCAPPGGGPQIAPEPSFIQNNAVSYNGTAYVGHETTPVVFGGVLYYVSTKIDYQPYETSTPSIVLYNTVTQAEQTIATGFMFASAFVHNSEIYVFATQKTGGSIYEFRYVSGAWVSKTLLNPPFGVKYFNHSVTRSQYGYVMAVETNESPYIPFTVIFYYSDDMVGWAQIPYVYGKDRYTACPTIRWFNGTYYLFYLAIDRPVGKYFTRVAKSTNLINWTEAANTVLYPGNPAGAGQINTSDFDLVQNGSVTTCVWIDGNQATFGDLKEGTYNGTEQQFCESFF